MPPEGLAWAELTVALDWLPLASLVLEADGTALAVSRAWPDLSGLAVRDSLADGWTSAVEPVDREGLRARLRDAAAARQAGCADARLTGGPSGRRSRWWWRPGPPGRLIVCVADLGEFPGSDDRLPPAWLARRGELVNVAGRALRRGRHRGSHVTVAADWLDDTADPGNGAGPASDLLCAVTERAQAAASPAGAAAEATPGEFAVTSAAVADEPGHDLPVVADMLVHCLFTAGLAVQSAAALADGAVAAQLQQVTDRLDDIICDTRTAVFESRATEHRYSPQAS